MGKTGAGKSSLCNALFASEVSSPVSDVIACTRKPLRFRLHVGERFMTIVDLPSVEESNAHDTEYATLYREQLSRLDLVLWLIKAGGTGHLQQKARMSLLSACRFLYLSLYWYHACLLWPRNWHARVTVIPEA